MNLQAFIDKYNGVPNVGDTPENRGQCVGLVEVALNEQGHPDNVWGNAKDLLANAGPEFEVIYNTSDNYPLPWDILCFNGRWGGGVGHTGVVTRADANTFTMFEQNNPTGSAPRLVDHPNYSNVIGWMRLKNNQGGEEVINDADNEFGRWNKLFKQIRGRDASREEFRNAAVGQTWLRAMEILSDSEESDAATHVQEVGAVAVRDDWQGQIAGLLTKVTDLTDQGQKQQKTITALNKQIEVDKTSRETLQTLPVLTLPTSITPSVLVSPAAPSESKTANLAKQVRDFFGTTQGRAVLGVVATIVTPIVMALQNFHTDNAVLAAAVLAAVTLMNTVKDAFNPNVPNK